MPPRIDVLSCIRAQGRAVCAHGVTSKTFTPSAQRPASTVAQRRRQQSPYEQAQARALRAARVTRQKALEEERAKALGDPVRGVTTPFIESLDTAIPIKVEPLRERPQGLEEVEQQNVAGAQDVHYGHFIKPDELKKSIQTSKELTDPRSVAEHDPMTRMRRQDAHETGHNNASTAMERILQMEQISSMGKFHTNVKRIIDTFGRHKTDYVLRGKPSNDPNDPQDGPGITQTTHDRAGPDTGSSEVQIAILTARIRSLANHMENNNKDKHNKKNLRLLVHRRQRLLQYMRRKERGGERWQFLTKTLGLTDGTWKGEISL